MNILVVDDEKLIREVIREYLLIDGYFVYEAKNGIEALEIVTNNQIDLIIMDIMMPKMDGLKASNEIKKVKNIPCIILSARSEEYDKLAGFEIGVDDYVTKPFSPRELVARVKAVLKRTESNLTDEVLKYGELEINIPAHEVKINNEDIVLTPKEYDLLIYLVLNKNIALSRENLLSNVWGYDFYGDDRTVDTHIKTLRNKFGKNRIMIKTIREVGYKFEYKKK